MARRKSAAKRESDFIELIMALSSLGIGYTIYYFTHNPKVSIAFGFIGLVVSIVLLLIRKQRYVNKVRKSKINDVDSMTGVQFEYFLKLIFIQKGYKVQTTKVTGDYGADLIMTVGDKRIVVQAKRYSKRVGIKAIQEVVSSIAYYKATEGWAVTNNEFTDAAVQLAKANGIRLIERNELINMISQLDKSQTTDTVQETKQKFSEESCPKCGSEVVLRSSNREKLYGCSSFPKCRFTRNVS
jgi:restriction system protein